LESFYIAKTGKYRLLKIALIYGANASGKTTILKALDFLRDMVLEPAGKKSDELDFQPFLFDKNTPKANSTLSIEFIQNEVKFFYEVVFNRKAVVAETLKTYNPNKATVFNRSTDLKNQFSEIKFGRKIKVDKGTLKALEANTLWNNTVLGGYMKTNIEIAELKAVSDWFKDFLHPLVYPDSKLNAFVTSLIERGEIKAENIVSLLRKADLNISNIMIAKEEIALPEGFLELIEEATPAVNEEYEKITITRLNLEHSVNNRKYPLPFELESSGTKRYYAFAGLLNLLIQSSGAIPIDELGASLHPDLFKHFLLTFLANAESSQIIATTHNREVLNDKDFIRDDSLWITDKSKNAATELYSFADFDSTIIRDTTNRLNAYKSGKLGGIPNVGDYYLNLI
ncbi:MAG: ATP-binding protein, partial [Bacteroidetes bacterium]